MSEVPGDDLYTESFSEVFDMASFSGFRNVGRCQLLVCTPKNFVPVEFRIGGAVN